MWGAIAISWDGSTVIATDATDAGRGHVYTSSSAGASWEEHTALGGKVATTRRWVDVAASTDGSVLLAAAEDSADMRSGVITPGGYLWASRDFGATWEAVDTWGDGPHDPLPALTAVVVSDDGDMLGAALEGGALFTSAPPCRSTEATACRAEPLCEWDEEEETCGFRVYCADLGIEGLQLVQARPTAAEIAAGHPTGCFVHGGGMYVKGPKVDAKQVTQCVLTCEAGYEPASFLVTCERDAETGLRTARLDGMAQLVHSYALADSSGAPPGAPLNVALLQEASLSESSCVEKSQEQREEDVAALDLLVRKVDAEKAAVAEKLAKVAAMREKLLTAPVDDPMADQVVIVEQPLAVEGLTVDQFDITLQTITTNTYAASINTPAEQVFMCCVEAATGRARGRRLSGAGVAFKMIAEADSLESAAAVGTAARQMEADSTSFVEHLKEDIAESQRPPHWRKCGSSLCGFHLRRRFRLWLWLWRRLWLWLWLWRRRRL